MIALPATSRPAELLAAVHRLHGDQGESQALVDEAIAALRRARSAAQAIGLGLAQLEPRGTWWVGKGPHATILAIGPGGYEIERGEPSELVERGVIDLRLRPPRAP